MSDRPRSESRQRTKLVGVRLTPAEHATAEKLAAEQGVTLAGLFRSALHQPASLPKRLWRARNIDDLSMDDAASQIGICRATIGNVELGKPYKPDTERKILLWLDRRSA